MKIFVFVFPDAIADDAVRYQYVKKKGYVRLHTNKGDLNVELHCDKVMQCETLVGHVLVDLKNVLCSESKQNFASFSFHMCYISINIVLLVIFCAHHLNVIFLALYLTPCLLSHLIRARPQLTNYRVKQWKKRIKQNMMPKQSSLYIVVHF